MLRSTAVGVAGLVAFALACSRPVPPSPPAAALYRDLQRMVTVAEASQWKIDRIEVENQLPDALLSMCATTESDRLILGQWLDARIAANGGEPQKLFDKGGRKSLEDAEASLELWRVRMLLRAAQAASRDCPFWVRPQRAFAGRQISDDRWLLSFAGGGRGNLLFEGGRSDLSFGGAGRLSLGRAIGSRWAAFSGVEFGGQASFPKRDGTRDSVILELEVGAPFVMRYRMVNSFVEGEVGYLASFAENNDRAAQGFRVGATFGARALLTRWFFPGAAIQLLYDRIDGGRLDSPRHTLRLGFRVIFDMNL